jgi:hypothetical protein
LMIWVLLCAVYFANPFHSPQRLRDFPESHRAYVIAMAIPNRMFFGAFVGSLGVGVLRWRRRNLFPLHPGHWMVIVWGVASLAIFVWELSLWAWSIVDSEWPFALVREIDEVVYTLRYLAIPAGFALAAARTRTDLCWMACLAALALTALLHGPTVPISEAFSRFAWTEMIFSWIVSTGSFRFWMHAGVGALLLAACMNDYRRGARRDWMHFVGAAAVVYFAVEPSVWPAWKWIAERWPLNLS